MADKLHHYAGWWEVPAHLMPATALRSLEFPREPTPAPHATVTAEDWSGRDAAVPLYDARLCPPTAATAGQLAAAAARSTRARTCADCAAYCQRPLPTDVEGRPLCPVCRGVVLLRRAQAKAGEARATAVDAVRAALADQGAAVVQVDVTTPEPTPAGSRRPPAAARIHAVDAATGKRLVDVLVSLVGARSRFRLPDAVPLQEATPTVHAALTDRPLIVWHLDELTALRNAAPHPRWPGASLVYQANQPAAYEMWQHSTHWRAQLDEYRHPVLSLPPGAPDRLLLHLRRIAAGGAGQ